MQSKNAAGPEHTDEVALVLQAIAVRRRDHLHTTRADVEATAAIAARIGRDVDAGLRAIAPSRPGPL